MAARMPLDSDLWWHLRAGETSLEQAKPLVTDVFSYTHQGEQWVNHSWLAQVFFDVVNKGAGFLGIALLVALAACSSLLFVYLQFEGTAPFLKAALLILGAIVSSFVWSARPQVLSLVLFSLLGWVLYRFRERNFHDLWVLPLIFILWSNLHGGYSLGFILIGLYIAGELFEYILPGEPGERMPWEKILTLVGWSVIAGFAVLINPNGLNMWKIPFQTVGVGVLQQLIDEWASPDFHDIGQQSALWLMFLTIFAFCFSKRRVSGRDFTLFLGFTALALLARRNFGPFALAVVPICFRHLKDVALRIRTTISFDAHFGEKKWQKVINLSLVGILGIVAVGKIYAVTYPSLIDAYIRIEYPKGAVQWIQENQPEGQILSEYNWGGFLIYYLPQYPVFVDGRTDLYGDQGIGEWIDLLQANPGWQEDLKKWNIHTVLIQKARPLVDKLLESGWHKNFEDDLSVVLMAP